MNRENLKGVKKMPSGLILYYSLTNTTARIAQSIAEGLIKAGYQTELCNIKDEPCPDLDKYDLIGFGTPVYYYNMPIIVLDFIHNLPDLSKKRCFAFLLKGSYAWNAGDYLKRSLMKHGVQIKGWFYCFGPGYFLPYNKLGYLASYNHPTEDEFNRAQQFGLEMGLDTVQGNWPQMSENPPIVYWLEQLMSHPFLVRNVFQKLFQLNKNKCIKCGLCTRNCPVNNLTSVEEGYPLWGRNCIMCLSCEFHCPQEAIASPVSWSIFKPLIRYNISILAKDNSLDKTRVSHQRGKIEFLDSFKHH